MYSDSMVLSATTFCDSDFQEMRESPIFINQPLIDLRVAASMAQLASTNPIGIVFVERPVLSTLQVSHDSFSNVEVLDGGIMHELAAIVGSNGDIWSSPGRKI